MFTNPHATQTLLVALAAVAIFAYLALAAVGPHLIFVGLRRRYRQLQVWAHNNSIAQRRRHRQYQGRHWAHRQPITAS